MNSLCTLFRKKVRGFWQTGLSGEESARAEHFKSCFLSDSLLISDEIEDEL